MATVELKNALDVSNNLTSDFVRRLNVQLGTEITTSTTLTSTHAGKYIPVNSASATNITINGSVFATNDIITIEQTGAGIVTIVQGSGMTLNGDKKSWGQYSVLYIFFKSATVATVTGGSA